MSGPVHALFVTPEAPVRTVIQVLNETSHGIALVTSPEGRLLDTITDGDIRRSVLAGVGLDAAASEVLRIKAAALGRSADPITAPEGTTRAALAVLITRTGLRQIPIVDGDGRAVDVVLASDLLEGEPSANAASGASDPLRAVVMAGGFGTRLRPLTADIPKPMLPVGDRPLLERTLERLRDADIHRVNISTHYLPEKITEHFGDGEGMGLDLQYMSEDEPLGTAGALSLMDPPEEPTIVMNGDILTDINFRAMLDFHREHSADLTVAVRQYDIQVPYGVLECDGAEVRRLEEKPTSSFLVNAGIYLLDPSVHRRIPRGRRYDMTDLIDDLLADGCRVVSFPIVEYWLDIGQHADYDRAQSDLERGVLR